MTTNEQFNKLLNDENVIKVTRKAASKFVNQLNPDEIQNCILIAIWKTIERHRPNMGLKFTTFLYRGVVMECRTQKKQNEGHHNVRSLVGENALPDKRDAYEMVDIMDEIDADPYKDILMDRFVHNFTTREIAKRRGVCFETIRKKIDKSLKKRAMVSC